MKKHHRAMRKLALVPVIAIGLGSLVGTAHEDDPETETVNVDAIVWSAFRSPETFDADLPSLVRHPKTARCLRRLSNKALDAENNKLRQCGQLLTGSPAWNECHEEAEALHNNAVVMNDIANAIDGPGRFDESQAYAFLILSKMVVTEAQWNALIDALQANTPVHKCKFEK